MVPGLFFLPNLFIVWNFIDKVFFQLTIKFSPMSTLDRTIQNECHSLPLSLLGTLWFGSLVTGTWTGDLEGYKTLFSLELCTGLDTCSATCTWCWRHSRWGCRTSPRRPTGTWNCCGLKRKRKAEVNLGQMIVPDRSFRPRPTLPSLIFFQTRLQRRVTWKDSNEWILKLGPSN